MMDIAPIAYAVVTLAILGTILRLRVIAIKGRT